MRPEHLSQHLAENKSLLIWKRKPAVEHTQLKLVHNYALMGRVYRICCVWIPCGFKVILKALCVPGAKQLQNTVTTKPEHLWQPCTYQGFPSLLCLAWLVERSGQHQKYKVINSWMPQKFPRNSNSLLGFHQDFNLTFFMFIP